MALVLQTFENSLTEKLVDAAKKNSKNGVTLENAMGELAKAIAGEVDAYIKTMTITIASGLVQVQGSPSAQSNGSPIVIENGIS